MKHRLLLKTNNKGIAIGPLLFIVVIMGILAAAIAAGSGSFYVSTSRESARTLATALIEQQHLIADSVQILSHNGCSATQISFESDATTNWLINPSAPANYSCHVFHPNGGRISYNAPPPSALDTRSSAALAYGMHEFTGMLAVQGIGDYANTYSLLMVTPFVKNEVAEQVNSLLGISGSVQDNPIWAFDHEWGDNFKGVYGQGSTLGHHLYGNAEGTILNTAGKMAGCVTRSELAGYGMYGSDCYAVLVIR